MELKQDHPYHLVDLSPWPILTAFSLLAVTGGMVMFMHGMLAGDFILGFGLIAVIYTSYSWWRDVINEGRIGKLHTEAVQNGLRIGMTLFIISDFKETIRQCNGVDIVHLLISIKF